MESRKVGCVGSVGDMGETTVLSQFAASALGNELVAYRFVVSNCWAGKYSGRVFDVDKSVGWVTGTRRIGEVSPGIVGSVVAVVVAVTVVVAVVAIAVGGTVVVGTVGTVLGAFAGLGLLARILVVGRLAKLGPGAWFGVVRRQVVLVGGRAPLLKRHSYRLFHVGQDLAGCDISLADDVPDERRRHGDDNHVTEYIVNVDKNRVA